MTGTTAHLVIRDYLLHAPEHLQLVRAVTRILDDEGIPPYDPDVLLIDRLDLL